MNERPIKPDAIDDPSVEAKPVPDTTDEDQPGVLQPTKLIRLASMTRALLDEVRQAPLDEAGRDRLRNAHDRTLAELRDILSGDLIEEFDAIFQPLRSDGIPSESEVRVAQAQLIGWLEGLFHGIQASLWSQQMAAQSQLAEMQRRQQLTRPQPEERSGLYI